MTWNCPDLACMCDIRLASERARFAETFIRLGIISGIGGSWFLPRVVGAAMAAELSFTGRVIDAEQARAFGLVSEVLPDAQLLDRAWVLAEEIAQHSGVALRYCKRLLRISASPDLRSSLEATAALQSLAHQSPEHGHAVKIFLAQWQERSGRRKQNQGRQSDDCNTNAPEQRYADLFRIIVSSSLGTMLEYHDFFVYVALTATFGACSSRHRIRPSLRC